MNTYGTVVEIKRPKTLDYRSLEESIRNPDFSRDPSGNGGVTDFDKFGRAEFLHLLFYALDEYEQVCFHQRNPEKKFIIRGRLLHLLMIPTISRPKSQATPYSLDGLTIL